MRNPCGKCRKAYNPYFVVYDVGGWRWEIYKLYRGAEGMRKDKYARAFCRVFSPHTPEGEYGDVYISDIYHFWPAFEQYLREVGPITRTITPAPSPAPAPMEGFDAAATKYLRGLGL